MTRMRAPIAGRVWRWPALLASLTLFGLLSALLGQGDVWWALSWAALGAPLAVILRAVVLGAVVRPR